MKEVLEKEPNVAKQSTHGHYIKKHKKVLCIDEVKEAFFIEGDAIMTSKNHGETPIANNSLVMPQQVYNPYTQSLQRSQD